MIFLIVITYAKLVEKAYRRKKGKKYRHKRIKENKKLREGLKYQTNYYSTRLFSTGLLPYIRIKRAIT
jgi:phage anti-repressor protein